MQVSPVAQNNTNFQAAHMSLRTKLAVGFSKRSLLNQCHALKEAAKERPVIIKASNESYKLVKSPEYSGQLGVLNFAGALYSFGEAWTQPLKHPQFGMEICVFWLGVTLCFVYSLVNNIIQPDKRKQCKKIIIQAGERYENGKLQGKKSPEITTNYAALHKLSPYKLIPISENPGKETFEPHTDVNNFYKWHIPIDYEANNY